MSNQYNQKLKILFLLKDLLENSDEQHPLDAEELILYLKNRGIDCERKSVYRDISILKEYGYDILKTKTPKSGYYIGVRDFELAEVRLLCDAVQAANFISKKKTRQLLTKIYSLASIYQADKIKKQVYVDSRLKTSNEKIYYTIDKLDTAIQSNRQVEIVYRKRKIADSNRAEYEEKRHTISPYALIWSNDHYYLIGNNRNYSNLMVTRVDRIKSVDVLNDTPRISFADVSDYKISFDSADYVNKHFNMFSGESQTVELVCDNSIIENILDRFGDGISIRKHNDDKFKISVDIAVNDGLVSWIMQFGKSIEVKSPPELKKLLLDRVEDINSVYRI